MNFTELAAQAPFFKVSENYVRIGQTRVSLETIIAAFKNGATCEEIVFQFPVLDLGDVYAAIGFYLKNQAATEAWFALNELESARLMREMSGKFPATGIRQRLLRRQLANQMAHV